MANIMSMTKLSNKPSRSGFDLSKRRGFTSNTGEILPVKVWDIIPGDDFEFDLKSFTRTAPLQTAAFTRVKEYYDFVFVPADVIWNQFNTMITQMGANRQTVSDINQTTFAQVDQLPYFTLFQLLDIYGAYRAGTETDMMGVKKSHSMRKLCWYLGYGDLEYYYENGYVLGADNTGLFDNPKLNPFPLLVYNKAYSDHFRNTQWENSDPLSFNINYVNGQSTSFSLDPLKNRSGIFNLRYSNWEKDLFFGLLLKSQFGNSASVDLSLLLQPNTANPIVLRNSSFANGDAQTISTSTGQNGYLSVQGNTNWILSSTTVQTLANAIGLTEQNLYSAFTILNLRKAEAEQKFREITQSVHQDYRSQVDAHWDEKVSDAYSDMSRQFGGIDGTLDINEVVNNNLTGENTADIQGKGTAALQGKVKFKNNGLYGWIICLYHSQPRLDYAFRSRLAKEITRTTVFDYAIPEFDKIGMDSVLRQELCNDKSIVNSPILGYAPRYYDYKTDIDDVVGAFAVDGGLTDWVAPLSEDYLKEYLKENNWSYPIMKVNPDILNPIFTFDAGKEDFTQEQFRTLCYIDVKAVRKLDRDGLPY